MNRLYFDLFGIFKKLFMEDFNVFNYQLLLFINNDLYFIFLYHPLLELLMPELELFDGYRAECCFIPPYNEL